MLMLVGTGASGVSSRGSEETRAAKEGQEGEASLGAEGSCSYPKGQWG